MKNTAGGWRSRVAGRGSRWRVAVGGGSSRAAGLAVLGDDPLLGVAGLGGGQDGERFLGGVCSADQVTVCLLEQPDADHPVQLADERLPECVDVEQDDGLAVQAEL